MAVLTSQLERESDEFAGRRERMEGLVAELRERTAAAKARSNATAGAGS